MKCHFNKFLVLAAINVKIIVLVLSIFSLFNIGCGQNKNDHETDQISKILNSAIEIGEKEIRDYHYDKAIVSLQDSILTDIISTVKSLPDSLQYAVARIQNLRGNAYRKIGNDTEAWREYTNSLEITKDFTNKSDSILRRQRFDAYKGLAVLFYYYSQGNLAIANSYILDAAENCTNKIDSAQIKYFMCEACISALEPDTARIMLNLFERFIGFDDSTNRFTDKRDSAVFYSMKPWIYEDKAKIRNIDSTSYSTQVLNDFDTCLAINEFLKDQYQLAFVYAYKGNYLLRYENHLDEAFRSLSTSYQMANQMQLSFAKILSARGLAEYFVRKERFDSADKYLHIANALSAKLNHSRLAILKSREERRTVEIAKEKDHERIVAWVWYIAIFAICSIATIVFTFSIKNKIRDRVSKQFFDNIRQIDKNLAGKTLEINIILEDILNQAMTLTHAEEGVIVLKNGDTELKIVASTKRKFINDIIKINESISGLAAEKERTIYYPDINFERPQIHARNKKYFGEEMKCVLAIPLIVQGEVIGVLTMESSQADKFTKNDIGKVEAFAGQAAIAILIAQLFENMGKHQAQIRELTEIQQSVLNSRLSLNEYLDVILRKGLNLVNKKHAEILLIENTEKGKKLVSKKSTTITDEGTICPMESICGLAVQKELIVYLPKVDVPNVSHTVPLESGIHIPSEEERTLYINPANGPMKSELVVPLVIREKIIGVFNIESDKYDDFKEDERNLLKNLALSMSIAINNAQHYEAIRAKNKALENTIKKDLAEMAILARHGMVHQVGGWVGYIRTKLLDIIDDYQFDIELKDKMNYLVSVADKVIDSRYGVHNRLEKLIKSTPKKIRYEKFRKAILENDEFKVNTNVRIKVAQMEHLPTIKADFDTLMDLVFFELITNAIGAMPNGGEILISGKQNGQFVEISVKDTGTGIDDANKDEIFTDGFTTRAGEKHKGNGLYVLKALVESYSGYVIVESKKGTGATFIVALPIDNK